MRGKEFVRPRDWVEPAHSMSIKLRENLLAILTQIRSKYQKNVDDAFDRISKQIGFVVTTTIPVVFEIGDKGEITGMSMGAEHLNDTLFDAELTQALTKMMASPLPSVSPGTYNLYLLWYEALKLKFRTEWVEPAHYRATKTFAQRKPFMRDWVEPVHWLDPSIQLDYEERVIISVIDEVYPELEIGTRVASYREGLRWGTRPSFKESPQYRPMPPDVLEPAHLVPGIREPAHFLGVSPEVMEPVHYRYRDYLRYPERVWDVDRKIVPPEVMEPVHYWYKDYLRYPERIWDVDRRKVWPEVQEPVQYRLRDYRWYPERVWDIDRREYWPEVQEPVQYRLEDYRTYPRRVRTY